MPLEHDPKGVEDDSPYGRDLRTAFIGLLIFAVGWSGVIAYTLVGVLTDLY
jgi:hypothetical protein